MKIQKILCILLVSIFLTGPTAMGVPLDLCTGGPNCPHCAAAADRMMPLQTGSTDHSGNCCAGSRHKPCDIESAPYTGPAVFLSPRREAPAPIVVAVGVPVPYPVDRPLAGVIASRLSPGSFPPLSTPLYIQKSSLLF